MAIIIPAWMLYLKKRMKKYNGGEAFRKTPMPPNKEKKMKHVYVCEVCGKTETLTEEEAYNEGWDYPPFMGTYGVLSARTCPDCPIEKTLWYRSLTGSATLENLTKKDKDLLTRIFMERENSEESI